MKCGCGCEAKSDTRLPTGWKRLGEAVYCPACWRGRYVLRAITIPVAGPVGREWPELREALREAWGMATGLSNWMLTEMYARDVRREAGQTKLGKQPKTYLYPEAREKFPDLPSQTVAAMERAVGGKYRASRYKLLWTNEVSLPNYRYPAPMVTPNQGWRAHYGDDNVPLIDLRLAGKRWTLRLRGGREYRRQLKSFARIVSGEAVQGELAIYRQRANGSDHRNGAKDRDGGGQLAMYRVMAKLVAWLPREVSAADLSGTLFVRTDADSLIVALNAKDERLWVYHGDQVRRWTAEHRRQLNRWSDDTKSESRPPKFQSKREAAALKYRRRMDSTCHEIAAMIVNYAARRKFAVIRYDDADRRFCDRLPWATLSRLIAEKADAMGIVFEDASGSAAQKTPGPLETTEVEE